MEETHSAQRKPKTPSSSKCHMFNSDKPRPIFECALSSSILPVWRPDVMSAVLAIYLPVMIAVLASLSTLSVCSPCHSIYPWCLCVLAIYLPVMMIAVLASLSTRSVCSSYQSIYPWCLQFLPVHLPVISAVLASLSTSDVMFAVLASLSTSDVSLSTHSLLLTAAGQGSRSTVVRRTCIAVCQSGSSSQIPLAA